MGVCACLAFMLRLVAGLLELESCNLCVPCPPAGGEAAAFLKRKLRTAAIGGAPLHIGASPTKARRLRTYLF